MRLKTLKIEQFRGFADAKEFEFADRFTVVAGINGRGKTALLDAIRILVGRLLPQVSQAKGQYPRVTPFDITKNQDSFRVSATCNCAGVPIQFKVEYEKQTRKLKATTLAPQVAREIRLRYGNPQVENDAAPLAVSYTTDRAYYRMPKELPTTAPPIQEAAYAKGLVNQTIDYRDLAHRLKLLDQPDAYPQHPELGGKMKAAFAKVLDVFLSGISNIHVTENPLGVLVNKGQVELQVFQLSDGERAFLAMCADLARRLTLANPGLEDPLKGAGVVLIDELELHLHPKWQRTVVDNLRATFPHIQFIATTHSPFVVQTLRHDELILLDDDIVLGQFENRGLEEIAVSVLGIADPEVSPEYLAMLDAAKDYFMALENVDAQSPQQRGGLRRRLNSLATKYAHNPAYQAILELETSRKLRD